MAPGCQIGPNRLVGQLMVKPLKWLEDGGVQGAKRAWKNFSDWKAAGATIYLIFSTTILSGPVWWNHTSKRWLVSCQSGRLHKKQGAAKPDQAFECASWCENPSFSRKIEKKTFLHRAPVDQISGAGFQVSKTNRHFITVFLSSQFHMKLMGQYIVFLW